MLAASDAALMGWLAFVGLILTSAAIPPVFAILLRRRIPDRRSARRIVPALRLGQSPKTRRSPRQAVAAHRTFLTGTSMTAISLVLIPFVAALAAVDLSGLLVAIGFVIPSLVVVLHSRRRDLARKSDA